MILRKECETKKGNYGLDQQQQQKRRKKKELKVGGGGGWGGSVCLAIELISVVLFCRLIDLWPDFMRREKSNSGKIETIEMLGVREGEWGVI